MADRVAELEDRLRAMEAEGTARGRSLMDRLVPPEARRHFRSGGRHTLLGMRSIVDTWIGRLDEKDAEESSQPQGRERITIE